MKTRTMLKITPSERVERCEEMANEMPTIGKARHANGRASR